MELKLTNGLYSAGADGEAETVSGTEELVQRIGMKLSARRGAFPLMPEFGSRLYTLLRIKPSERSAAARQFIAEALADETGLELQSLELDVTDDGTLALELYFLKDGAELEVSAQIGE